MEYLRRPPKVQPVPKVQGPQTYDKSLYEQAGILRNSQVNLELKECMKNKFKDMDIQDAVNRYKWYNLPCNITSQDLEKYLYQKGQLCFFYNKELKQFYFMPYALDGTIDFYGRYNTIHPVPMTSGTDDKSGKAQAQYLSKIKLNCVYAPLTELPTVDMLSNSAVILKDYTDNTHSQMVQAREVANDTLLDAMAECVPMMRTALLNSTGVKGMRVNNASEAQNVLDANLALQICALTGNPFTPIEGVQEFQELTNGTLGKAEEYMLALQSLDNLRLSTYGIDNGGLFEKKAHELQSEADINGGPVGLVAQDGLSLRQYFCQIVRSIWPDLGIWCELSETVSRADINGDGLLYDENDNIGEAGVEQPEETNSEVDDE